MAWNFLRYLANAARGASTVVPFAERSLLRADRSGDSSVRVVFARLPDFPEMKVWRQFLGEGELFVDVGANVGLYTMLALECGCSVVALEPAPDMVDRVRDHLALNAIDATRIQLVQAAALDRPGTVELAGPDPNRRVAVPGAGGVAAVTLDSVIGDRAVRGMKIDVEGNERLVLEGARSILKRPSLELLQLEWNDASLAALGEERTPLAELLHQHGFVLFRAEPAGVMTRFDTSSPPGFGADVFAARGSAIALLQEIRS